MDDKLNENTSLEIGNIFCLKCNKGDNEKELLLCDKVIGNIGGKTCDKAYHSYCVGLSSIPDGSWFCPGCKDTNHKEIQISSDLFLKENKHKKTPKNIKNKRYIYYIKTI